MRAENKGDRRGRGGNKQAEGVCYMRPYPLYSTFSSLHQQPGIVALLPLGLLLCYTHLITILIKSLGILPGSTLAPFTHIQPHLWSGLTKTAQRPGPDRGLGLRAVRSPRCPKTGPDCLVWSLVFAKCLKTRPDRTAGSLLAARVARIGPAADSIE
jgi:hypothetical protein